MKNIYEPGLENHRGWSTVLVSETDRPLIKYFVSHGGMTLVGESCNGERITSLSAGLKQGWGGFLPTILVKGYLKGSAETLYWQYLIEFGGAEALVEVLKITWDSAFEVGREAAQADIRKALGIQ